MYIPKLYLPTCTVLRQIVQYCTKQYGTKLYVTLTTTIVLYEFCSPISTKQYFFTCTVLSCTNVLVVYQLVLHCTVLVLLHCTRTLHPLVGDPVEDGPAVVAERPPRVVRVDVPRVGQRTLRLNTRLALSLTGLAEYSSPKKKC